MSLISGIQAFIRDYTGLATDAIVSVDQLGASVSAEYAVVPLPGARVIEGYINGGSLREYPFALQSKEYTADELTRLATSEFFEGFADWLEAQTAAGTLPSLGSGQTATLIEATGWAHLYQIGQSDVGIYQIMCRLEYEQAAPSGA